MTDFNDDDKISWFNSSNGECQLVKLDGTKEERLQIGSLFLDKIKQTDKFKSLNNVQRSVMITQILMQYYEGYVEPSWLLEIVMPSTTKPFKQDGDVGKIEFDLPAHLLCSP